MDLTNIIRTYDIIKNRLPADYPRPKLAFFEDEQSLLKSSGLKPIVRETVLAVAEPNSWTIRLPLTLTGNHFSPPIDKLVYASNRVIASLLLHEIAHLYAGEKYGYNSTYYSNERYCNKWANKWLRKMIKEHLL